MSSIEYTQNLPGQPVYRYCARESCALTAFVNSMARAALQVNGAGRFLHAGHLSSSVHLRREYIRILRPGIATRSQNDGLAETDCSKLFQEGAALLGPGDSGKPVVFAGLYFRRERLGQYELGRVDCATF